MSFTPGPHKLGRLHRTYDARVPHMSALVAGQTLPPPPPRSTTRRDAGQSRHDAQRHAGRLHLRRRLSRLAGLELQCRRQAMDTEPDSDVEKLYILACGYNPRVGGEGPGGNEQHVLTYLLKKGAPTGPNGRRPAQDRRLRRGRSAQHRRREARHQRLRRRLYRLQRAAIHRAAPTAPPPRSGTWRTPTPTSSAATPWCWPATTPTARE